MNKYQEALNNLWGIFDEHIDASRKSLFVMQELVERATPKKPSKSKKLEHDVKIGRATFRKGTSVLTKCPTCDHWLRPHQKFCDNCGQKLDDY